MSNFVLSSHKAVSGRGVCSGVITRYTGYNHHFSGKFDRFTRYIYPLQRWNTGVTTLQQREMEASEGYQVRTVEHVLGVVANTVLLGLRVELQVCRSRSKLK